MKNYKKGLLAAMVLAAMSLMAADDKIIYVNTFDDENGENANNCSLREAIETARKNAAFGGCKAGNTANGQNDIIQLEAGEYKLSLGELVPETQITIQGKSRWNFDVKNKLTGNYPAYEAIKTTINAQGKSRILNTGKTEANVVMQSVRLTNGYSNTRGGAVNVGGSFVLSNGIIDNSKADIAGGAIYASTLNTEKNVDLVSTLVQSNQAPKGSVLAMDCVGNFGDSKPNISFTQSSFIENGSANSQSIFDYCGQVTSVLMANTIAKNRASATTGSIIKAIDNTVNNSVERLSAASLFSFTSNTIVENDAYSTYYYDKNGSKSLAFNVLAFNKTGKSCRYLNNTVPDKTQTFYATGNAFELTEALCDLPESVLTSTNSSIKNIDVKNNAISTYLTPLQETSEYNLYLPLYYPLKTNLATSLMNTGLSNCSENDQRGLVRITDGTLQLNPDSRNSCEIGSVESMDLTAADVDELTNSSIKVLVKGYQDEIDGLKADINDPVYKEYKIANQEDLSVKEAELAALKNNLKYRAIYFNPFEKSLPQEVTVIGTQSRQLQKLNADNYTVSAKPMGIGSEITIASGQASVVGGDLDDLKCEWDAKLHKVVIYRAGGDVTDATDFAFCQYTLTEKTNTSNSSSGILKAVFKNIEPIVESKTYSIDPSSNLTLNIDNLMLNASEEGDGPLATLPSGKALWNKDVNGLDLPIHLDSIPAGLNFTAERSGQCPGSYVKETCYGGKLSFSVKNNLSQFDYPVKYSVFDSEGAKSNIGILTLKNTAKNTNTSSSGGGSFGILGLISLFGLVVYRRRMN